MGTNETEQQGVTTSERYLGGLARQSFLSLWSYSNLYTTEGRKGAGVGKEFSDLTVIFENSVILFSDKDSAYPTKGTDVVKWARWYRRAIDKSVRQLELTRFRGHLSLMMEGVYDAQVPKAVPARVPAAAG